LVQYVGWITHVDTISLPHLSRRPNRILGCVKSGRSNIIGGCFRVKSRCIRKKVATAMKRRYCMLSSYDRKQASEASLLSQHHLQDKWHKMCSDIDGRGLDERGGDSADLKHHDQLSPSSQQIIGERARHKDEAKKEFRSQDRNRPFGRPR
jgi:hypothetical protein